MPALRPEKYRIVYCRELAPGTVTLTGGRVRGDDNKQYTYSRLLFAFATPFGYMYVPVINHQDTRVNYLN